MSQKRLFDLVYYLLEHGKTPAPVLAGEFEVSVRTIYRDVDALSAAGVPVYAEPGRGGGVALMEHFVLDRAAFTEAEQSQLLAALRSLRGTPGLDAGGALSKLSGLFHREVPHWLEVDLSRWGTQKGNVQQFELLKTAILSHKVISFTYAGSYGEPRQRQVLPARLVFKGQAWYLQGISLDTQEYRTFKLARIRDLQMTDRSCPPPPPPPPLDAPAQDAPSVKLVLRLSPALAYRAYDEFDPEQIVLLPDGSLRVEAEFPEDNWVYGFLLSLGPMAEILSPERVRKTVAALAKKIAARCENPDIGCQGLGAMIEPSSTKEDSTMDPKNMTFCQSCGMPLADPSLHGSEKDGSPSSHYCKHCYQGGAFTGEMTMEEMIAFCAPMTAKATGVSEAEAKEQMEQYFPQLLRWKKS